MLTKASAGKVTSIYSSSFSLSLPFYFLHTLSPSYSTTTSSVNTFIMSLSTTIETPMGKYDQPTGLYAFAPPVYMMYNRS